jgi:site-specific DNA-methyltransferase (adenine-specific)
LASPEQALALLEHARMALELVEQPREAGVLKRYSDALRYLVEKAGASHEVQNEAAETALRARRRLGEILAEIPREQGKRTDLTSVQPGPKLADALKEAQLSEHAGKRCQWLAAIDEPVFDAFLANVRSRSWQQKSSALTEAEVIRALGRSEREQAAREEREQAESNARVSIAMDPAAYRIECADVHTWRPDGVHTIVTDPPYVGDSIPLYVALAEFAAETLPSGGALVVMTWQAILPDVIRALAHPELSYRWCIDWRYANVENTADHTRRLFDSWKPVLVYHKDGMPDDAAYFADWINCHRPDKDFHEWGQSVAGFEQLIRSFSRPGETVCDPFLGGGTTLVAALANARRFLGADIDERACETARARLTQPIKEAA